MYESFYGLDRAPFAVTPDPGMLFLSAVHREALATIIYGVETRKGFIVCTGEVGTGKSTIVRAFFDQAQPEAIRLIYVFTPQVTPLEMAQYICGELALETPESVFAAVPRLQLKLLEEFESGRTVVLVVDEAQLLPPETLEFLRLLSNFETDTEKLIQIVLVGQPEVDSVLARHDMRQVNQRVALRAQLAPFGAEESVLYMAHRLRVSGAADLTAVMTPSAALLIAEAGGGIPRRINILADNALIAGFAVAQRPLGGALAGGTIREFLAKSGAAGAVRRRRFIARWRAARRLRSALARERTEPSRWLSAAPAKATDRSAPRAPWRRVAPDAPGRLRGAGQPTAQAASRAPAAASAVTAAGAAAKPPVETLPVAPLGRTQSHPAAKEEAASADFVPLLVGFADLEPEPAALPRDGAPGGGQGKPGPVDDRAGSPAAEWPALSRVRNGLQPAAGHDPAEAGPPVKRI